MGATRKHVTGSCVDVSEADLKGLLHVFSNILGSHRWPVINGVTVESLGSQYLSTWIQFQMQGPETVGLGKRRVQDGWGRTNSAPVV